MRVMATDFPEISQPNARAFLTAYATMGVVSRAAKAAGVTARSHYNWLNEEGERGDRYREAFAEAKRQACDVLEAEARRRACDGVERMKFFKGDPIMVAGRNENGTAMLDEFGEPIMVPYTEHEYSDTLMMFMLKGVLPEKYRERRSVETSGPGGKPIEFRAADLTDDELAAVVKGGNGEAVTE